MGPNGGLVEGVPHHNLEYQNEHDGINKESDDFAHPIVHVVDELDKSNQEIQSPHPIGSLELRKGRAPPSPGR
jgi:hypothetical protein